MKPVTLLFFFIIQTYCRSPQQREGRWFGYTYTSTITKSQHVTSLILSSCVQYAATLPPCRNVRSLDIPEGRFLYMYVNNINYFNLYVIRYTNNIKQCSIILQNNNECNLLFRKKRTSGTKL